MLFDNYRVKPIDYFKEVWYCVICLVSQADNFSPPLLASKTALTVENSEHETVFRN